MKNLHGNKIEEPSLDSMIDKIIILALFVLGGALFGAPQESLAVQEMRLSLENIEHRIHSQSVEINLFQERLQNMESSLGTFKQELKASLSEKGVEKRISTLEKAHEALIADFKILKGHINETNSTLTLCQNQLNKIDKQLSSDIQSLKSSIQSMLALLQPTSSDRCYTVRPGDSLGQIAIDHKTSIKTLKELNHLSSDVIYSGQKIALP